jgi:hypothetical protein
MALNPTLAAGVVMVAYKNKLVPIRAEEDTIDHFLPKFGISISAAPRRTPGTPTTAMIILIDLNMIKNTRKDTQKMNVLVPVGVVCGLVRCSPTVCKELWKEVSGNDKTPVILLDAM